MNLTKTNQKTRFSYKTIEPRHRKHHLDSIWFHCLIKSSAPDLHMLEYEGSHLHLFICKLGQAHVLFCFLSTTDDEIDVGMLLCTASQHAPVALLLLPTPFCSHPSSIDHVAQYKSTVSWTTLQVP